MAKAVGQFTIIDLNDITISSIAPSVKVLNMIWLDTSVVPNQLKKWSGATWINIGDRDKITTYYQFEQPLTGKIGDLWFKTDARYIVNNMSMTVNSLTNLNVKDLVSFYKIYRYNGTEWKIFEDSDLNKFKDVIDEHGQLIAEKLSGTLNTAIAKVQNSTGKTTFDDRGLIVHDQPLESTSTKAMLMTADGLLIANAKNPDGTWRWRTAATGDSISADEITTGTLTAITINGVTITGSKIVSESAGYSVTIDNGEIEIYDKVNERYFFEAKNGNVNVNGYLKTGYTENATMIDDYGIWFNDGTNWASTIRGGTILAIDSPYGINLSSDLSIHLGAPFISVSGNFSVSGLKNCRIKTEEFNELDFSAYETAEVFLGDIGESEVLNGECVINLDEKLLACVNTDILYQVFLTKYGQGDIWVEQRNASSFIVKGDNIKFGWEVKAKRKNYENIRFGQPK